MQTRTQWNELSAIRAYPWIPAVIGCLCFWLFTGGKIVTPGRIDWILASNGDPVTHYAGWQFFRNEPFFQWPIGKNYAYGEAIGSSIVFSDSIPLLALAFKVFSDLLPPTFQYFGMWILLCFVLQAVFAWRILARYVQDRTALSLATGLFVLSPVMLWRLQGHDALVGHWLILAALDLFLGARTKVWHWPSLLCLASLIHAYLCAMVACIWLADVVRRVYVERGVQKTLAIEVLAAAISLPFVMALSGYFISGSVAAGGFGLYRANLLAFFNPSTDWSIFYKSQYFNGDYEGFGYLGAGVITLVIITAVVYAIRKPIINATGATAGALAVTCVLLLIFSASNHVALGHYELFSYQMPSITNKITSTFRVSGRFIWPIIYIAELATLFIFFKSFKKREAVYVLLITLLLQGLDLVPASQMLRARWYDSSYAAPLRSAFWESAGKKYKRIAFVLPAVATPDFGPIVLFAASQHMTVNGGSFARVDPVALDEVRAQLLHTVLTNSYRADTLYVFVDKGLWQAAVDTYSEGFTGEVDGYRIVAPHWDGCTTTCGTVKATPSVPVTQLQRAVSLVEDTSVDSVWLHNWSGPEPTGRWTDGKAASVQIYLGNFSGTSIDLTFRLHPFVNQKHPQQRALVSVNGNNVSAWDFRSSDEAQMHVHIDAPTLKTAKGVLTIEFLLPDAISPKQLGLSNDYRYLSLFVSKIDVSGH